MALKNELLRYWCILECICFTHQNLSHVNIQTVYVHTNMTEIFLNCSTQAEVAWLRGQDVLVKGGRKITTDRRIKMIIDTNIKKLHINDISSNYTGVYSCVEYDDEVSNVSIATYNVIVVEHLTVQTNVSSISVLEGTNATLLCMVVGRPEPVISWYILGDSLLDIGIGGKILQINNFSRECAVPYVCIANNGLTENVSTTITLIPKFPPEVHVTGKGANKSNDGIHFTARLYSPFNFTCSVIANPFVNITITRNNKWLATIGRDNSNDPVVNFNGSAPGAYDYSFTMNFKHENEPYMYSVTTTGHLANSSMFNVHKCMSFNNFGSDKKIIDIIKKDN